MGSSPPDRLAYRFTSKRVYFLTRLLAGTQAFRMFTRSRANTFARRRFAARPVYALTRLLAADLSLRVCAPTRLHVCGLDRQSCTFARLRAYALACRPWP